MIPGWQLCLDYKELVKGRPVHVVIRERTTGSTYGLRCLSKGASQEWLVQRLVAKIDQWGLQQYALFVKSDCEPAMRALQRAIKAARPAATHLTNSPAHDPQASGVAERAVREYTSVLRRMKFGLEWRLGTRIDFEHPIMDSLTEHTCFVINMFGWYSRWFHSVPAYV